MSIPTKPACAHSVELHRAFTDRQPEQVAAHLQWCETCRAEWESLEKLAAAARGAPTLHLSSATKDQLRSRLLIGARAIAKQPPSRKRSAPLALAGLVLALAATALAWLVAREPSSGTSASVPAATSPAVVHRATIRPHPGARYAAGSPQPDEVVHLYDGVITVDVKPLHSGERFRITTSDAEVEVHGTVLKVSAEQGRLSEVDVIQGRVEVRYLGVEPQILGPGQRWVTPNQMRAGDEHRSSSSEAKPTLVAEGESAVVPSAHPRGRGRASSGVATKAPGTQSEPPTSSVVGKRSLPTTAEIAFQEGWAALRSGNPEAASRYFASVPIDSGLGADALFWRGVALGRAGRSGEAMDVLGRFLTLFPSSPHRGEALVTLGTLLERQGNEAAAIERYREAKSSSDARIREHAEGALRALEGARAAESSGD